MSARDGSDDEPGVVRVADLDELGEPDDRSARVASFDDGPDVEPVRVASFDDAADAPDSTDAPRTGGRAAGPGGGPDLVAGPDPGPGDEPRIVEFDDDAGPAGASPGHAEQFPTAASHARFDGPLDAADPGRRSRRPRRGGGGAQDRGRGARSAGRGRSAGTDTGTPADDEARAKEICLRLLTDRARTVKELRDALVRKEIPENVADRVLERFDEVGLVDDEAFAGQWVRSRHHHRGLGRRAIAQELRRKGVAKEIADEALTEVDAESEQARARELVAKKIRTVKVGTREERASASRRLVGMLARKGYGAGVAYTVVREAIAARGADEDELGEEPADD